MQNNTIVTVTLRFELSTGVYDWRKELEAIYITESAGGTESYVDRSIDFILADLCRIADTIWDACTELTKQIDILEISRTG